MTVNELIEKLLMYRGDEAVTVEVSCCVRDTNMTREKLIKLRNSFKRMSEEYMHRSNVETAEHEKYILLGKSQASDATAEVIDELIKNNDEVIENVSDKDKIKLEIDRLIDDSVGWDDDYYNGYRFALERVIEFISKM